MDNNTEISLNLTVEKVNLLLAGLAELPYRVTAQLIAEINQQAQEQLQARVPDKAEKTK